MISRKMISIHTIQLLSIFIVSSFAQSKENHYKIDITEPDKTTYSDHLNLGGSNLLGDSISFNNYYMLVDNKPYIPITGEFHYSRYPNKYWDESIKKMKAGGINTIATYVFWIIHEEKEGVFEWTGDYNLRKFIELCKANDIHAIVRIGPFCHGEIRNGGLPDWLLGKSLTIRSNDELYLSYVNRLYKQIGKQLEGLLFKDGGPVIGIQIENEYQHSASPWGLTYPGQPYDFTVAEKDRSIAQAGVGIAENSNANIEPGNMHMKILKTMAIDAGMDVPIYTATGWGNAAIIENESIPVASAYPYPTWAKKSLSPLYLYQDLQKTPDYAPIRYKAEDYPYIAAEIGGGIMGTYTRRPTIPAKSLDALINRFLGSGTNGIGYYMFHGGSTPHGKVNYFSDEAYGYPKISYDFQAPIGEYGQIRPSFNRLKVLHYFISSYAEKLAPMQVVLPENKVSSPEDISNLRYSIRKKGSSGFVFMHNYQDHAQTRDINNISFEIQTDEDVLRIPETGGIDLLAEENMILPFNIDLNGIMMNHATAQILLSFKNSGTNYVIFFAPTGIEPEFSVRKQDGISMHANDCAVDENNDRWLIRCNTNNASELSFIRSDSILVKILVISREQAEKAWRSESNSFVIFSDATTLEDKGFLKFLQTKDNEIDFQIYPKKDYYIQCDDNLTASSSKSDPLFSNYTISIPEVSPKFVVSENIKNKLLVEIPVEKPKNINDFILQIDYTGDTGMGFLKGELVADHFYKGDRWEIGLRKFMDVSDEIKMSFYFRPLYKEAPFYQDLAPEYIPDFKKSKLYLSINSTDVIPVYQTSINVSQ